MKSRIIVISTPKQAEEQMELIGVDPAGIKLMRDKAVSLAIKISDLKPTTANIIKQDILSLGGEAATARGTINHSVATTDLLLFANLKQLKALIVKLKHHQFDLPQLALELETVLHNYNQVPAPLKVGDRVLDFSQKTYIMGILNVTPDSFSDGGQFNQLDQAIASAKQMIADGADIIDIGGESTRPGAEPISVQEELERVLPVIEQLKQETKAIISIDTTKSQVAKAALEAGACLVNDISGLNFDQAMADIVAQYQVPLILMHIKGRPANMQVKPSYDDVMAEIIAYLTKSLETAKNAGVESGKLIVDPGIGFGKTLEHNLEILRRLPELKVFGLPILVGTSRKSLIGQILDLPVTERVEGTAATVALALAGGANLVRVHDVKPISRVVKMADAILRKGG